MVEDRPGKHRVMFDRRSANAGEVALPWLELLVGFMFCYIQLKDDEELRGSGSDLDSFFNRLRQCPNSLARSAFGRRVSIEEAAALGVLFSEPSRQVVRVDSMGGINSPAFAQEIHLEVLRAGGWMRKGLLEADGAEGSVAVSLHRRPI